jgi:hypothetical protein
MPFINFGQVLYYNQSGGIMTGPYGFNWSPYEAAALNLIAGERAKCGNQNAPCNIGEFLQDLPEENFFQFVDENGYPRANANVRIYQAEGADSWYGKTFDNTFDLEFNADSSGFVNMGKNPFTRTSWGTEPPIEHTHGIANGLMILRIEHQGQIWYRFFEVTEFNMQYWMGNTQDAYYTIALEGPNDALPGDVNCDGVLNFFDIDPFVMLLVEPAGYAATYACDPVFGDMNRDDQVDFFDIDPFVAALLGG